MLATTFRNATKNQVHQVTPKPTQILRILIKFYYSMMENI